MDIDPNTFNIDLKLLEKAISKKTKAIIPVHLFGQTVDIPQIKEMVTEKKLRSLKIVPKPLCSNNGKKLGLW